jgi:fatty-acyl-CoA synthase
MKKLSYAKGEGPVPLFDMNMGRFLKGVVGRHGDKTALVALAQSARLSFRELQALVDQAALALLALGIEKSERVGIWSTNRLEWVVMQFAVTSIGAVLVHINPAYREDELAYSVEHVNCKALFLNPKFRSFDCLATALHVQTQHPCLQFIVAFDAEHHVGCLTWSAFLEHAQRVDPVCLDALLETVDSKAAASIQYTSGTTGKPKGATLTHHNMLNNGTQVGSRLQLKASDVFCVPVPLFHCAGSVVGVIAAFSQGASVVFPGEGFDAEQCIEAIDSEQCTAIVGVPMMYISILHHPQFVTTKMQTLQKGIMGASTCPSSVFKAAIEQMSLAGLSSTYGMTETSPMSTQSFTHDDIELKSQTVGCVHPHLEIKIVEPDTGDTVELGQTGELCVRGYSVMQGYWNDPKSTAEAIDVEGWIHSGDLAVMHDDAYVSIVGRIKDMVNRAGENIYPREIEEFFYQLPEVAEVQVFGVPDALYGEQLAAWIKLKPGCVTTVEDLQAQCKGKIASYKIPHYLRLVDDFPSTASGKVQKFKMRDIMVHDHQLHD